MNDCAMVTREKSSSLIARNPLRISMSERQSLVAAMRAGGVYRFSKP